MLKHLFVTATSLIFKPSDAWKALSKGQTDDHESFLSRYVYPFIGLVTLVTFFGFLLSGKENNLQIAIKESIVIVLSFFIGFFLSAYSINEVWQIVFRREPDMKLCQRFVGYSSSLMYCLEIVLVLLPEFFFLRFLVLYTIYMVWEGAMPYMEVGESEQLKFVGISTFIIIVMPLAITFVLYWAIPGLGN